VEIVPRGISVKKVASALAQPELVALKGLRASMLEVFFSMRSLAGPIKRIDTV
jgi:hypothetical protein